MSPPDAASTSPTLLGLLGRPVNQAAWAVFVERYSPLILAAARAAGKPPTTEGSLHKLLGTDIARSASRVHTHLAGPGAMLAAGEEAALGGLISEIFVSVPGGSIAGGTDEIQHGILGERALGLPKEPQVDKDIPFREVRTNAGR